MTQSPAVTTDYFEFRVYAGELAFNTYMLTPKWTIGSAGTNMQLNVGDTWKTVTAVKINVGDTWKPVTKVQINVGDIWKSVF